MVERLLLTQKVVCSSHTASSITRCSLVGKAPGLGPGDRRFESFYFDYNTPMAQWLEYVFVRHGIVGSIPTRGAKIHSG